MRRSVVYFLRSDAFIKVGTSADLRQRVMEISNDKAPVRVALIGALLGGERLEKTIHADLASFRAHGEWFEANVFVERIISYLLRRGIVGDEAFSLTDRPSSPLQRVKEIDRQFVEEASGIVRRVRYQLFPDLTHKDLCAKVAAVAGVNYSLIWCLLYRLPSSISAGQMHALRALEQELEAAKTTGLGSDHLSKIEAVVRAARGQEGDLK